MIIWPLRWEWQIHNYVWQQAPLDRLIRSQSMWRECSSFWWPTRSRERTTSLCYLLISIGATTHAVLRNFFRTGSDYGQIVRRLMHILRAAGISLTISVLYKYPCLLSSVFRFPGPLSVVSCLAAAVSYAVHQCKNHLYSCSLHGHLVRFLAGSSAG